MAEYQQTVYEIQGLLALPEVAPSEGERVRGLAQQYAEAVSEVNARLRECDEFLRKGNRDEAVRRSKADPDLLEAVGTLDFLERQQWGELLDHFKIPRPANLLTEIAEDLNAAFAATQSLAQLMRLHRLYALARRPLRERVSVMRQIARLDSGSPFWQEDLGAFEKARLDEVPLEIDTAARNGDIKGLARLDQELRSEDWRERPPAVLVQRTGQLHKQLRSASARRELAKLADKLNEAHLAMDAAAGRQTREAFNNLVPVGITDPGDRLLEVVAPAMQWLADEDRRAQEQAAYEASLRALENGINSARIRPEKLEKLYYAVAQHDAGVPERLEQRYQERRRDMALKEARRNRLRILTVVLVVAALAALTWYIARQRAHLAELQRHVAEVQGHAAALAALLKEDKLEEAGQYVEGLKEGAPAVYRAAEIQKLCADLAAAVEVENQRQRDLEQHLQAAKKLGVDDPTWETVRSAFEEIEKALKIANPSEKSRVLALKQELQQRTDHQFADDWKGLEERMKKLDPKSLEQIDQIRRETTRLKEWPHVSPDRLLPVASALERLEEMKNEAIKDKDAEELRKRITKAVGDPDGFARALADYAKKFPKESRAEDFASVAEQEVGMWKGLKRWDDLLARWARVSLTGLSPQRAEEMAGEGEKLGQELADSGAPTPTEVSFLLPHLKAVAARGGQGGRSIVADLEEKLKLPTVADLMMVKTKDAAGGERFYFQQKPNDLRSKLSFVYIKTIDLKEMDRAKVAKEDIANPLANQVFDWTSPQARFSSFARDKLGEIQGDNWEPTFYAILQNLAADQEIEPVLKVQLMQLVLETACKGSHCFQQAFRKHLETLEGARLDPNANWLDPRDESGQKARRAAKDALARLPDLKKAGAEAGGLYKQVAKGVSGARFAWVGWLLYDKDGGKWTTCVSDPDSLPKQSGKLVVVFRPSETAAATQAEVGTLLQGHPNIAAGAKEGLKEGRPVFLHRNDAK